MPAPKWLQSNGLYLGRLWGGKKRFTVCCGGCGHVFTAKVPITEPTAALCPACRASNQWSLATWDRYYTRNVEAYNART